MVDWHAAGRKSSLTRKRRAAARKAAHTRKWRAAGKQSWATRKRNASAATSTESTETVRALTIRQPWPELILRGRKMFEIRGWSTKYRGHLVIHAGAKVDSESAEALGLTGDEVFDITGIAPLIEKFSSGARVKLRAKGKAGAKQFEAVLRIDTPQEALYYANGGILQYVLRQLLAGSREPVGA